MRLIRPESQDAVCGAAADLKPRLDAARKREHIEGGFFPDLED